MVSLRLNLTVLVLGLAVTLSGCNIFKSSSTPNDKVIVAEIQSKLYQDPALKSHDIHVVSQKGVVVLTGTVASSEEKNSIGQFAQSADGTKQVINELKVSTTPTPAAEPSAVEHHRRNRASVTQNEPPPEPVAEEPTASPEASTKRAPVVKAPPATKPSAPPPPPQPVQVTIPAGTVIPVRTVGNIDSSVSQVGDTFEATLASPITENGRVVVPRYAKARLRLVEVRSAGHIRGRSAVEISLVSLDVAGQSYQVDTSVYQQQAASSRGKRSAEVIGGAAGLGALIGAIAGGGKGAAIGAAVGAGGGTAVQAGTKARQVKIPSETRLDFNLRRSVTVTLPPGTGAQQ